MSVLVCVGVHILCSNGAHLNMQCYTGNNSLFLSMNISANIVWIVQNKLDLRTGEERAFRTTCLNKEKAPTKNSHLACIDIAQNTHIFVKKWPFCMRGRHLLEEWCEI